MQANSQNLAANCQEHWGGGIIEVRYRRVLLAQVCEKRLAAGNFIDSNELVIRVELLRVGRRNTVSALGRFLKQIGERAGLLAGGMPWPSAGKPLRLVLALLPFLACVSRADAALLGLTLGRPDISVSSVQVSYDCVTDTFHATGIVSSIDYDGKPPSDYTFPAINATFDITATINDAGVATSGTLTIYGKAAYKGINTAQTLLKGNISGFGFQSPPAGGNLFDFRFDKLSGSAGGALAADFGTKLGVNLNAGTIAFDGHFNQSFANVASSGAADVAPEVPEPASLILWSVGGLGLAAFGSNRSRRRPLKHFRVSLRAAVKAFSSLPAVQGLGSKLH